MSSPITARIHVMIALAAMGPCSWQQLRRELLNQHSEANRLNVDAMLGHVRNEMTQRGEIEIDNDEPENPVFDLTEMGRWSYDREWVNRDRT